MKDRLFLGSAILSAVAAIGLFVSDAELTKVLATALLLLASAAAPALVAQRHTRPATAASQTHGGLPRSGTFRGREGELAELMRRFNKLRQPGKSHGAVIIAIHGMPGVGKSALAQEFARILAPKFPDGQLYANLGNAGRIRAEADILNRFVPAIRPAERLPGSTVERAARFRSLTANAKLLVILDAARDHEQVARLLPSGAGCAVIVTSRRDLGPAMGIDSYHLGVPQMDDALEILHALSHVPANEDHKFAIEIVDRLGGLPMAIRAVGDAVVANADSLRPAARRLREPDLLGSQGRFVQDRIDSEYGRLTSDERRAFRMASLVPSPSFVPWMLVPLLQLDPIEVEKIVSRLSERQLLEPAGLDQVTGVDRYRFHPVFRVYAEMRRNEEPHDAEAALDRVDSAYLEAIDLILAESDPSYRQANPPSQAATWFPSGTGLPMLMAEMTDRWVRAEYLNLLRCVKAAHRAERYGLCWRIAARLGDCVPDDLPRGSILEGLALGYDAATRLNDQRAMIEVMLARGGLLSRLAGYRDSAGVSQPGHAEAFEALATAVRRADRLRELQVRRLAYGNAARLQSDAHRRMGEAHLRNGAYRTAARELDRAELLSDGKDQVVALMKLAIPGRPRLSQWGPIAHVDDEVAFWHGWVTAELHRADRQWKFASKALHRLLDRFDDDASRVASILVRLAEVRLEQFFRGPIREREHCQTRAVHRAAEAVYRYQHMHDEVGAARARCVFARGLITMGQLERADEQYNYALSAAQATEPVVFHHLSPIQAMLRQTEGELLRERDREAEARAALMDAARLFRLHGDYAAESNALLSLGLDKLPPECFSAEPPGRQPRAWLESAQATLRVGQPFEVWYSIGPPAMTEDLPPADERYLDVLLEADRAEVSPAVRTARLDPWAQLDPLRFEVVPKEDGVLTMHLMVYSATDGSLLQKSKLEPQEVADAEGLAE